MSIILSNEEVQNRDRYSKRKSRSQLDARDGYEDVMAGPWARIFNDPTKHTSETMEWYGPSEGVDLNENELCVWPPEKQQKNGSLVVAVAHTVTGEYFKKKLKQYFAAFNTCLSNYQKSGQNGRDYSSFSQVRGGCIDKHVLYLFYCWQEKKQAMGIFLTKTPATPKKKTRKKRKRRGGSRDDDDDDADTEKMFQYATACDVFRNQIDGITALIKSNPALRKKKKIKRKLKIAEACLLKAGEPFVRLFLSEAEEKAIKTSDDEDGDDDDDDDDGYSSPGGTGTIANV